MAQPHSRPSRSHAAKINGSLFHYQFPYVKFHDRHYPMIPVTLRRGHYAVKTFALVDSGASMSVFRPEIARALRIAVKDMDSANLGTPTGGVRIGLAKVLMDIERTRLSVMIGFSDANAPSFNILGRQGLFPRFSICFNEVMRTVVMVPLERLRPPGRRK
jgi:hypothetical protein